MAGHVIRSERAGDTAGIRRVHESAFGRPEEAALVDALRDASDLTVSLVAVDGDEIVGHVLFTPVTIESVGSATGPGREAARSLVLGLAPIGVLAERQREGIGSRLMRRGLDRCRELGCGIVVVLGHPSYYPRFGFEPAIPRGLTCVFAEGHEDAWMVAELVPGALESCAGLVRYRPEFSSF